MNPTITPYPEASVTSPVTVKATVSNEFIIVNGHLVTVYAGAGTTRSAGSFLTHIL